MPQQQQQTTADDATDDADVQVCQSWCGGPVRVVRGPLGKLRRQVPTFHRRLGDGPYRYRITRRPMPGQDGPETHVADVTDSYCLVQHGDVLDGVQAGVDRAAGGGVGAAATATMVLGPDERRMDLTVDLPWAAFTPADGFAVGGQVSIRNSVDTSCALFGGVGYLRWACHNGMMGWDGHRMRRVHNGPRVLRAVLAHVADRLRWTGPDRGQINRLLDCRVDAGQVADWVDTVVAARWGRWDAVRVYHVALHGVYGDPVRQADRPPHRVPLRHAAPAAAACAPVTNLYHLMQALSYVASRSDPYETRLTRLVQVQPMVEPLAEVTRL